MPLVKCEYCNARVSPLQLKLHHKRCAHYKRFQKKSGFVKIEDPSDVLTQEEIQPEPVVESSPKNKKKNR